MAAPSVDQYIASVRDFERRADDWDPAILPPVLVSADRSLAELVELIAFSPLLHVRGGDAPEPPLTTDSRHTVRWVGQPTIGWVIDQNDPRSHINGARMIIRNLDVSRCDRCEDACRKPYIVLAEVPPAFAAIALCRFCTEARGLLDYVIT